MTDLNNDKKEAAPPVRRKHYIHYEGLDPNKPASETTVVQLGADRMSHIVENWHNTLEVFPLRYGSYIAAVCGGVSGFYMTSVIRKHLHLLHTGNVITYFGSSFFSMGSLYFIHELMIRRQILTFENGAQCPVCLQVQSGLIQAGFGVVQPAVVSSMISLSLVSTLKKSYRMPNIIKNPKGAFRYATELIGPTTKRIPLLVLIQLGVGMTLAYFEQDVYLTNVITQLNLRKLATIESI